MDKILSDELLLSAAATCPPECALLGDFRNSFDVGDKLKIGDSTTICIVVSVSEKEMVIKRYSDFLEQQKKDDKLKKKTVNNQPYYRKYCGKYCT